MSAERRLYLLDIEGTVAPLSLTAEVLFPYARAHFANYIWDNRNDPGVRADLELLLSENRAESPAVRKIPYPSIPVEDLSMPDFQRFVMSYVLLLMDRDRKSTALKSLQGKIWKAGFESGELKGELFPDVPDALKHWSAEAKVAIYSSGSVEAQQLLFRYSNYGDLTPYLAAYFDTRTGPKKESASYTAVAAAMGIALGEAIFFSDVVAELDAAREGGCQTRLVVRPGNAVVEDAHGHTIIESFDGL